MLTLIIRSIPSRPWEEKRGKKGLATSTQSHWAWIHTRVLLLSSVRVAFVPLPVPLLVLVTSVRNVNSRSIKTSFFILSKPFLFPSDRAVKSSSMKFRSRRIDSHQTQLESLWREMTVADQSPYLFVDRICCERKNNIESFDWTSFRFNGEFTFTISGRQMPDGWTVLHELCDCQWKGYWSEARQVMIDWQQSSILEISFQTHWNLVRGDAEQICLYRD